MHHKTEWFVVHDQMAAITPPIPIPLLVDSLLMVVLSPSLSNIHQAFAAAFVATVAFALCVVNVLVVWAGIQFGRILAALGTHGVSRPAHVACGRAGG